MPTDLLSQIPKWEQEAEDHERKARALRQIIEGVRSLNGDASRLFNVDAANGSGRKRTNQYSPDDGPRGREAVRLIVAARPDGLWKTSEIKAEVARRGWPSSAAGIDTAIKRMEIAGEAKREDTGLYRFAVVTKEVER